MKKVETVIAQNATSNPVLIGFTRLAPGEAKEVKAEDVGAKQEKQGFVKILDSLPVDAPAPEQKEDAGSDGEGPKSFDEIAQALFDAPELISDEDKTREGSPSVAALEDAFGRDFSADDRDVIWAKVKELQVASFDS